MRSGYVPVDLNNDVTSRSIGVYGYDWARLAVAWGAVIDGSGTSSTANYLYFNSTTPLPSNTSRRLNGFVLRCLSTAVEGEESGENTTVYLSLKLSLFRSE